MDHFSFFIYLINNFLIVFILHSRYNSLYFFFFTDLSISKIIIIVSVMFSLLALVLLSAVYAYYKKRHSAETETVDDNWEIDPRDLTLLEKIGEGFFGDVLKAEIHIHFSQQLKLGNINRQDADDKDNNSFVACKKLKGANTLLDCFLLFTHIYLPSN